MIEGRRRTISTSKIKKIIVIRKKRSEKGRRVEELESNPHSKGEAFSRLKPLFEANTNERNKRIKQIRATKIKTTDRLKIIPSLNESL